MNRIYLLVFIITLVFLPPGTNFGQEARGDSLLVQEPPSPKAHQPIDPLLLDDDIFEGIMEKRAEEQPQDTVEVGYEERLVPGFRVQIFSSPDGDAAREVEAEASATFQELTGVYLEYDVPNYKVRLGDCESWRDAERLKEEAFELGYTNAWVVRTQIIKRVKKINPETSG